jgi:hypothetical protein
VVGAHAVERAGAAASLSGMAGRPGSLLTPQARFHHVSEVLQEPRWNRLALEQAAGILEGARETGWRCGLPRNTETPGLMMGLAGIGYGLLRLAAPEQVPSVLSLALPG